MKPLKEYLQYEQPTKYIVESTNYNQQYDTPVLTAGQSFILGYTSETFNIFPEDKLPVIIFDDFTTAIKYVDFPFKVKSSAMKILHPKKNTNIKYFYYLMQNINFDSSIHKRYWISEYSKIEVEERTFEEQNIIVKVLDKITEAIEIRRKMIIDYDKLIESKFNELIYIKKNSYDIVPLEKLYNITSSKRVFQSEWTQEGIPFYRAREIIKLSQEGFVNNELFISPKMYKEYSEKYGVPKPNDILVTGVGTLGVSYLVVDEKPFYFKDGNIIWLKSKNVANSIYINYLFSTNYLKTQISDDTGATVGTFTITKAKKTLVILPPKNIQDEFVDFLIKVKKIQNKLKNDIDDLNQIFFSKTQDFFD